MVGRLCGRGLVGAPRLIYVRPNGDWSPGGPWLPARTPRLAWEVTYQSAAGASRIAIVWVDTETGAVLGGHNPV